MRSSTREGKACYAPKPAVAAVVEPGAAIPRKDALEFPTLDLAQQTESLLNGMLLDGAPEGMSRKQRKRIFNKHRWTVEEG